jgi:hypothetical protein
VGQVVNLRPIVNRPHPAGESQRSPETRAHCAFTQHPWLLNRRFYDESALSFFEEVLLEEMKG